MLPGEPREPALKRLRLSGIPPADALDAAPQFPNHEHAQVDLSVVDPGEPFAHVHVGPLITSDKDRGVLSGSAHIAIARL